MASADDELAASPAPSNAVIVSADIAPEGGTVHRGNLVYLAGTAQKRGRGGWSRPRVSKKKDAGRPFGVVYSVTQDLAAVIVSGACTVIMEEEDFKKYDVGDRINAQSSIETKDYTKTIVEDAAERYSRGKDAFKALNDNELYEWAIGPEPINNDAFSEAILTIIRQDTANINDDELKAFIANPRVNVAPPTQITRKFKIEDDGTWQYTGIDLDPPSYGPLADRLLYDIPPYTGIRTPQWGASNSGQQLTAAFEHAGLEIDKICKHGRTENASPNEFKRVIVFARMLALSRFGPTNSIAAQAVHSQINTASALSLADLEGNIVQNLPFAMVLEKGPTHTARILLGSMV